MREKNTYKLTKWEQETIFNFNEDEKEASVYTYNKALIRRLDGFCEKFPDQFKLDKESWYGKHLSKTYILPKKYVSIRKPTILSDAQKIASAEKAKNMRKVKSQSVDL